MRRRHQLRPDTFPFLAVLLCAMGSLILVLMELDRRARCAANGRAEQAWRKTEQDKAEVLAHLQAEHEAERQRQLQTRETRLAAHQAEVKQLHQEAQDATAERSRVQAQLDDLLHALQTERVFQSKVEKEREHEQVTAEQLERDLAEQREQLTRKQKSAEGSRAEREQLTRDLLLLEASLRRLKLQRERAGKTWSVVPYVGKRGLNRRPLYVECDANGLLFYPDKKRLGSETTSVADIRGEIERRTKEFAAKLPAGEKNRDPYWMLLVRPSGVNGYYAFLQAVRSLDAAYGYEFVDGSWDLDFPDPASLPPPVEVATPLPTPVRRRDPRAMPLRSGNGDTGPVASLGHPDMLPQPSTEVGVFPRSARQPGASGPPSVSGVGGVHGTGGSPGVGGAQGTVGPTGASLFTPQMERGGAGASGGQGGGASGGVSGMGGIPGAGNGGAPGGGVGVAGVASAGNGGAFGGGAGEGGTAGAGNGGVPGGNAGAGGVTGALGGGAVGGSSGVGGNFGGEGGGTPGGSAGTAGGTAGGSGGSRDGGLGGEGGPAGEKAPDPLFPTYGGGGGPATGGAGGEGTSGEGSGNGGIGAGGTGGTAGVESNSGGVAGSGSGTGAGGGADFLRGTGGGAGAPGSSNGGGSGTGGQGASKGGTGKGGTGTASGRGDEKEPLQPPGPLPSAPGNGSGGAGEPGATSGGGGGGGGSGPGEVGGPSGVGGGDGGGGGVTVSGGGGGRPAGGGGAGLPGSTRSGSGSPPLRPAARYGPSEWLIVIDCMPQGVRVSPSRLDISAANLAREGGGAPLLKTVQDQVARRRAFDRPGEAPVRIAIRFVVHKDGLRVFHQVYPLLDSVAAEKRAVLASE